MRNELNDIDDLLTERLKTSFPNPDRLGCPSHEFLRGLAKHKIPIEKTEAWLDHLVTCSQCFDEYTRFTTIEVQRRRRLIALGAAAAVLFVALASEYVIHRTSRWRAPDNNQIAAINASRSVEPGERLVVLDLQNVTTVRGPNQANHLSTTLPRAALKLEIYLPANSQRGTYDVELLKQFTDTKALLSVSGSAEARDGHAVLHVSTDLRSVPAGSYYLALRHGISDWRYYRIVVS